MKPRSFILIGVLLSLFSCGKEELESCPETGNLHIEIGLFIRSDEVERHLKATSTGDFYVGIYTDEGLPAMTYEHASEMPEEIVLPVGEYYVEAHSNNDLPASFENPFYHGISDVFAITGNGLQAVGVNCELANTMVSIIYSDRIRTDFTNWSATVESSAGSLAFSGDETRPGYFRTLPLSITVELAYTRPDGNPATKTLTGSIPDPLANRHYEVHADASIDQGMASFQIAVDESDVPVEVIEINDSDQTPGGAVGYGELLITEIMYDPYSLSDTEGEWIEIYNASDHAVDLQNLVLMKGDADRHVISEAIGLLPGDYYVLARSAGAVPGDPYIYGSSISLNNDGAVISLLNAGTEEDPGAVICSVDYGADGFPDPTGASIILNPDLLDAVSAVLGTSWCVSSSVFTTGDAGTPWEINDACNPG